MTVEALRPRMECLRADYVLAQAWKKTEVYIRRHNWYSDVLELDRVALNVPQFLDDLKERLGIPDQWRSEPLRMVPAPKSQQWRISSTGAWGSIARRRALPLRPLAHVHLRDQVAATAALLCLANRVETLQGDPLESLENEQTSKAIRSNHLKKNKLVSA
jgi:hypothetical protein